MRVKFSCLPCTFFAQRPLSSDRAKPGYDFQAPKESAMPGIMVESGCANEWEKKHMLSSLVAKLRKISQLF